MNNVNFLNLEYVFLRIVDFFKNFDIVAILNWLIHYINYLIPLAIVLCIFLVYVILYARRELGRMGKEDADAFAAAKAAHNAPANAPSGDEDLDKRWKQVMRLINSNNPTDWRLAILEADIMLGDVLTKQGFQGDTIGDQLKGVSKGDFLTLDQAWEAHKIRNQIAHGGSDFQMNEREAKRVVDLYKTVFSEFYHI